jgi:hypothetical protein
MTRLMAKKSKKAFNEHFQDTWVKVDFKKILNNEEQDLINLIHIQEGIVNRHSNITKKKLK